MFSDRLYTERLDIENDPVIDNRHGANGADRRTDATPQSVPVPGEVEISSGAVRRVTPQSEQHCAFQNKTASIVGLAESVQESLGGVSLQQELKVLALCSGSVQQPGADRCRDVSEWPSSHEASAACRYALTTDRARQASAARMIWSAVASRRRNPSCRASSATSRPILLR